MTATVDLQPEHEVLAAELAERIDGEVRFDAGTRAVYSTDSSNYRQVPIGVVLPRSIDDVIATVAACRRHSVPIVSRGGGTSLAGQTCNVAVVIDFSKYLHHVVSIDPERRRAVVEPGCNLDTLRQAAAPHGLTFGPDPATHSRNTLGGMIGNDSCGVHSVLAQFYGPGPLTVHQVVELDVLTYDGTRMLVGPTTDERYQEILAAGGRPAEIHRRLRDLRDRYADLVRERYPHIPRRVSGYNLDWLLPENGFNLARALVGSEGTCVTVLRATVELIEPRPERVLVVLGYPDVYTAADHVPEIMAHRPVGLEGLDDTLVGLMRRKGLHPADVDLLPEGAGWLMVELGGATREEAEQAAGELVDAVQGGEHPPSVKRFNDAWEEKKLWDVREAGLGATAHVPGQPPTHPGWEDSAVAPNQLGAYLREFRSLLDEFGYHAALYGHFGQGCLHCRIDFDLATTQGVRQWTAFLDRAAHLVVAHGGSLSGEHGDGQARAALLEIMFGPELVEAFARFKAVWDPADGMNPGKVVRPHRPDEDLRQGPAATHVHLNTRFSFRADGGSFFAAADRCVGVGACRDPEHGTMCPSYMATREETQSTRGRARALYEMMRGEVLTDRWRSQAVLDTLDLCLACKACKHECPVNVDMATYKAEFLSHHYRRRLRPREAYSMGLIHWWLRAGSVAPGLANRVLGLPGVEPPCGASAASPRSARSPAWPTPRSAAGSPGAPPPPGRRARWRPPPRRPARWCGTATSPASPARATCTTPTTPGAPWPTLTGGTPRSTPTGSCSGSTRSPATSTAPRPGPRCGCWSTPATGWRCPTRCCAAGAPSTTTGCWPPPTACGSARSTASSPTSATVCRSWAWSRAAWPPSATSCPTSGPTTPTPRASAPRRSC